MIDYHYKLGIQRFIIYDNSEVDDGLSHYSDEERSHLPNILKDYIDKQIVVLIRWPYKKELPTKTSKYLENSNRNNNENIVKLILSKLFFQEQENNEESTPVRTYIIKF